MIGGKIKNGWDLSFERSHPFFYPDFSGISFSRPELVFTR